MPNWNDPALPADNIVTLAAWRELRNNLLALNDIIGHSDGGHVSLTDGGILLGNGQGAWQAMAVLATGSLVVGDGVTDPAVLTIGADDTLLRGDSGQTEGVVWEEINWNVAEVLVYG